MNMRNETIEAAYADAIAVIDYIADYGLRDAAMEAIAAEHQRRQAVFADAAPMVLRRKPIEVPQGGALLAELAKRALAE